MIYQTLSVLLLGLDFSLPLTNPVLKFLVILVIILFAPIILNRAKIPPLLGLIIAGAVIGSNGINLMERDSSIILSGTAGLLYIMFLAGLEIDMADFKRNSQKSLVFGIYTFVIPMLLGILGGIYVLKMSIQSAILLASMFASHTLIAYPLISKMGVSRNIAVNVAVGGTLITDTLALLVLAVIVGMSKGVVGSSFWIQLLISITVFGLIVLVLFPIIGRWFFKRFHDSVSQYIFVLVLVFLGAVLAELAGIEAIIGAFLAGLALNKLIPHTSALMNRIEFVGNAIFIPFFLIGVGMLIDYRVFIKDVETLKVAAFMTLTATLAKFIAAWLTQKTFKFSSDERLLIFGLSNAQAAATLAAVLVGYNIIIGTTETGASIRLLDETILNGTILMILVTCTLASFAAQKGATNIAFAENANAAPADDQLQERILVPLANTETIEELVSLALTIKSKSNKENLFAISIIETAKVTENSAKNAQKILSQATNFAAATDNKISALLRYDSSITNGISHAIQENQITDVILGLHRYNQLADTFLGSLTEDLLQKSNTTTFIYKAVQPIGTINRYLVLIPDNAEKEIGFPFWLIKLWNIAKNTGAKLVLFGSQDSLKIIKQIQARFPLSAEYRSMPDTDYIQTLKALLEPNDQIFIILSRKNHPSYYKNMEEMPRLVNQHFTKNGFIIVYPMQMGDTNENTNDLMYATIMEPLEKLDEIAKTITKIFTKISR